MKASRKAVSTEPPEILRARIEEFVRGCRLPAVFEPGEKTIPLERGRFDLQVHGSGLVLHAWSNEVSLVRRIVRAAEPQRGRLDLIARRLAQGESSLAIVDLARDGGQLERQAGRLEFRERFRRILGREFPEWEIAQISATPDLEHSLSPVCTRALVTRGQAAFAVIAAEPEADPVTCDHILSFGLIWLEYLRAREKRRLVEGLKLFLPRGRSRTTANRLVYLDRSRAACELYELAAEGSVVRVEEATYGNLATALDPARNPPEPGGELAEWIERLTVLGAEKIATPDGLLSLRVKGLELARAGGGVMTSALDGDRPVSASSFTRVEELAAEIAAARSAESPDKQSWFYRALPERWLESIVRQDITRIDSNLLSSPVYSQVPAIAGADRGIIDLLAVDHTGRLAVIELKASEDIHLPVQGLDYWMRVKWHHDRGELEGRGYFRGIGLQPAPPRLLLVSPAFDFHPTTETIVQFFSATVEVERIGLGADWKRELKVVFRARGAERPA